MLPGVGLKQAYLAQIELNTLRIEFSKIYKFVIISFTCQIQDLGNAQSYSIVKYGQVS